MKGLLKLFYEHRKNLTKVLSEEFHMRAMKDAKIIALTSNEISSLVIPGIKSKNIKY